MGFSFVCDLACVSDVCFSDMAITASAVFLALSLGVCVCMQMPDCNKIVYFSSVQHR